MNLRFLPIALLVSLAACSGSRTPSPKGSEPFQVVGSQAQKAKINKKTERTAKAMHNYLIGELAYDRENFSAAEKSFTKASQYSDEPVGPVHLKLAELLLRSGSFERALEESQRAIDADRDNSYPWLLRGGILESLGRFDEARELYREVMTRFPKLSGPHILFAAISALKGKTQEGIAVLESYIARAPKDVQAHGLLGYLYEMQAQNSKASEQYQQVLTINGQSNGVSLDLVRALIKDGKVKQVLKIKSDLPKMRERSVPIEQLLKDYSTDVQTHVPTLKRIEAFADGSVSLTELHFRLAVEHSQAQEQAEALRELTVLLAIDPKYELARYYRASMYAGLGRKKEAIEDLLAVEPEQELYIKSRTFAAFLLRQDGDLESAERVTREALKVDPDNRHLFSYLILVLKDARKFSDAEALLNDELEKDPRDEKNLFNLAVIQKDLGKTGEALETMEKIIEINPKNSEALNYVAYSLAEGGSNLNRAEELSNRALQISPDDAFYLDTLGWVYFKQGHIDRSVDTLKRAALLSGNDLVVLDHYGDALMKQGNVKEAYTIYRMVLEKARDAETIKGATISAEDKKMRIKVEEKLNSLTTAHPELVLSTR